MLVIPGGRMQTPGIGLQHVGVKTDRSGGKDFKRRVEKHKPQQKESGRKPTRRVVEPNSERRSDPPVLGLKVGRYTHDAMFGASLVIAGRRHYVARFARISATKRSNR